MSETNKKVLIVSSYCFENASANGICARALYDSFLQRGCETHILGMGDGSDFSENEHTAQDTVAKSDSRKKFAAVRKLLKSFFVPVRDTKKIENYYNKIKELQSKHNFDVIVAMFFPGEIVSAVKKLKQEQNTFEFVIYELDSVADGIGGKKKGITKMLSTNSNIRWSKSCYRWANAICILKGHEEHAKKIYGKLYGDKIRIVDLPLLKDNVLKGRGTNNETVEFVYSGELNSRYRPPHKLLDVWQCSTVYSNWNVHFYSKGDCEGLLKECGQRDDRIKCHGYVNQEILHKQYDITDIFISIGNTHSNSVPSKIINYISFGKPIIHFCLQDKDICEYYLNQYPLAMVIKKSETAEASAKKIADFVAENSGKIACFEDLCKALPMNVPAYSVEAILEGLK